MAAVPTKPSPDPKYTVLPASQGGPPLLPQKTTVLPASQGGPPLLPQKTTVLPASEGGPPLLPQPAGDPRKVTAGATSGKSGAVAPAPATAVQRRVTTAQASAPAAKTGRTTKTTAAPPNTGNADLSAGDLTSILNIAGETQTQVSQAYAAGASAQAAQDATAANASGAGAQSSSTPSTSTASATGGGILSSITGNYKVLLILAGTVGAGYYLYRRNKNGMPLFSSASEPMESA